MFVLISEGTLTSKITSDFLYLKKNIYKQSSLMIFDDFFLALNDPW